MAMVDASLVLNAIMAVSIAAGAFFAVLELRTMAKNRRTELLMRANEFCCSREWAEAAAKFIKARFQTPEEAEEQVTLPALIMIGDYCEGIATLAERGLVPKDVVTDMLPIEYTWDKIKVWARAIDDPKRPKYGLVYPSFEWLANEARKTRLAADQKAKGV